MATLQKNKELKLLIKILGNIERAPKCTKYKCINMKRITQKLTKSYMDLLMCFGFYKSDDGRRLLFHEGVLERVPLFRQLLLSYNIHNISDLLASLHQTSNALTTEKSITNVVDVHHEEEKEQTQHNDSVQVLLDMGFDGAAASVALKQNNDDIGLAVQHVLDTRSRHSANTTVLYSLLFNCESCPYTDILQTMSDP
eukprot:410301_1